MFWKDLNKLIEFVNSNTEELGWTPLDEVIRSGMAKLDAAAYDIVVCDHRPESNLIEGIDPLGEFGEHPHVRIGKSMGDGTYRQRHRAHKGKKKLHSVTDRLSDHRKLIRDGLSPNEAQKYAEKHARAWDPFWDLYGYGPDVLKKTWVNLKIPTHLVGESEQIAPGISLFEIALIFLHKDKYHGEAPLTDLEFRSSTKKEMLSQIEGRYQNYDRVVLRTKDFLVDNETTYKQLDNHLIKELKKQNPGYK